jgi:hypothetical protein
MVIFFTTMDLGGEREWKKSGFKGEDIQNWGTRDFFFERIHSRIIRVALVTFLITNQKQIKMIFNLIALDIPSKSEKGSSSWAHNSHLPSKQTT